MAAYSRKWFPISHVGREISYPLRLKYIGRNMTKNSNQIQSFDNQCWPSGRVLSPCSAACPVGTNPAAYIMAIHMGDYDEAFRVIARENPLPGVCGRMCHHPCEDQCVRNQIDQPIAIRALKRFAIEKAGKTAFSDFIPMAAKTGRRVAIVGAGPSGLAAARDLAIAGHEVTVYEKSDDAGGILNLAAPSFVLPPSVLQDDIRRLEALEINFSTRCEIRSKKQIEGLFAKGFDAVLMAFGAMTGSVLPGFSADNPCVESGLAFLMRTKRNLKQKMNGRVLVIGGGDVAVDVARVCVRKGAKSVEMFCLEERECMPADQLELDRAEKEGVKLSAGWGVASVKEAPSGITVRFCKVKGIGVGDNGCILPALDSGKTLECHADHVILAVGQRVDPGVMSGIRFKAGKIGSNEGASDCMLSHYPGLFVAGDVVINPGTISEAIGSGKAVARAIDRYLMGERKELSIFSPAGHQRIATINEKILAVLPEKTRQRMPEVAPEKAVASFKEVTTGFSESAAKKEAERCLNCAMCSNCIMERQRVCQYTAMRLWGG